MIEKIVLDYLNEVLSVPAYLEKPEKETEKYVLIEKTGSAKKDFVESATIALQSYANSLWEAANLNKEVKTAMDNIIRLDSISSSKLNTDYNYTDTSKKKYRYQAIYDLVN